MAHCPLAIWGVATYRDILRDICRARRARNIFEYCAIFALISLCITHIALPPHKESTPASSRETQMLTQLT